MSLPELYELQHCLVHVADVVARAIIKRQQPAADLVTKRALYREFGRGWVDKHIAPRGKIEGKRFGTAPNSPIKYSRTEFVALLEAERLQRAEIIGKYGQQETKKENNEQVQPITPCQDVVKAESPQRVEKKSASAPVIADLGQSAPKKRRKKGRKKSSKPTKKPMGYTGSGALAHSSAYAMPVFHHI